MNTMEFVVRALRGWAVPLVIPVSRAWQAFDGPGRALDLGVGKQLRELGAEVTKALRQFRSHGFWDYSSPKTSRRLCEEYVVYFAVWPMLVGDGYSCGVRREWPDSLPRIEALTVPGDSLMFRVGAAAQRFTSQPAPEAEQLQQVVPSADEQPLPVDLFQGP